MTEEVFTPTDIRGRVQEGMSMERAWNIGKALADWLPTYGAVVVLRGYGSNETLMAALVEGLRLQGRPVIDAGKGDKPVLLEIIKADGLSGGVIVSRDDDQDVSVIEMFDDKAELVSAENGLTDIAELVDAANFVPAAVKGELTARV